MAFEIDQQIRKIIDECYAKTEKILKDNKDLLDLIATNLAKYETLTKEQIEYLVEHGHMREEEEESEDFSLNELKELAKAKGIKGYSKMSKEALKEVVLDDDKED